MPYSSMERAVVRYESPEGPTAAVLFDGTVGHFGRAGNCLVRFGFAPAPDDRVPRVAGRLIAAGERVWVDSLAAPGRPVVEVRPTSGPTRSLAVGEGYSPPGQQFDVVIYGDRTWILSVSVRPSDLPVISTDEIDHPPTRKFDILLSELQLKVLDRYVAPMRRGRLEPATHQEVADHLSLSRSYIRKIVYDTYAQFFLAGVPMPDVRDKQQAVVDAYRIHGFGDLSGDDL